MLQAHERGFFPYTPPTNLLYGLDEALDMLLEEGLERFDMALGTSLGWLAGRVFRIGHLGAMNELMLAGTLSGVEMGLALAGVPHRKGGAGAALEVLIGS